MEEQPNRDWTPFPHDLRHSHGDSGLFLHVEEYVLAKNFRHYEKVGMAQYRLYRDLIRLEFRLVKIIGGKIYLGKMSLEFLPSMLSQK